MSAEMVQDSTAELMGKHQLFRDDVVESASQPGLLGFVVRYRGDPESDSDDDYSESDSDEDYSKSDSDEDYSEDVQEEQDGGHVPGDENCAEVMWLNATEPVQTNVAELLVVDRTLTNNDVVRWASSPSREMGKVVDISVMLDLELEDGTVTQQVDSKTVTRVRSIATGDAVVKGPWVGRVVGVEENVTIVFKDGAKCKILEADPKTLVPTSSEVEDEEFPYYPGQKVRAKSAKTFKKATWLGGRRQNKMLEATVVEVETATVDVKWIQNQHDFDDMGNSEKPEEEQNSKVLDVLNPFSYAQWSLGDRCVLSKSGARIVNIKTKADVLWQNGNTSRGIDSCKLMHTKPKEHDFWPGQSVTETGTKAEFPRKGVVKRSTSEGRTAVVLWMQSGVADEEEIVGIHKIGHKPEEVDKLGDLVFQLSPKAASKGGSKWVGCIRAFSIEGDIEVIWQDGSVSSVKPSEVKIQPYEDDSESSSSERESESDRA